MKLPERIFQQTSYNFIQQIQKFLFGTVSNILIVNALPREEYGIIGIVSGYTVFVMWFAINPEAILAKKYKEIRKKSFSDYISILINFGILRIFLLGIISIPISVYLFFTTGSYLVSGIMVAHVLVQSMILLSGMLQYILKIEFKQKEITKKTFFIKTFEVLLLLILFVSPNLTLYYLLAFTVAIFESFIWFKLLIKVEFFKLFCPIKKVYVEIKDNLFSFSIWQHLNNNLIQYIYQIDTVFLSFWVSLTVIGNYSIALKIANFSFILPSIIQNSTILSMTRITDIKKRNKTLNIFLKYSFLISIFQFLVFIFLGKFYVLLYSKESVDEIYLYTLLILSGITILNIIRPIFGYIISQMSVKSFFFWSVLPAVLFSTVNYFLTAKFYGAMGVAIANIINYSFFSLTIIIYLKLKSDFKLEFILLERREVHLIKGIFNKLRR
jgi:O-antigen/teichoic acid export membrane protein